MSISEKLTTIAENEQKVYDAGRQEMNEVWWNMVARNSNYMFTGMDFSLIGGFNPPFQVKPTGHTSCIFQQAKNMGVITAEKFDFSELTTMNSTFDHSSGITEIELMDLRNVTSFNYMLNENYSITKIGKLILKDDGSQTMHSATFNVMFLEEITIEGKFGSDVSFWICSRLTHESLMSIINALYNYSETGETRTLTLHATAKARLSEEEIAIATQKGWTIA